MASVKRMISFVLPPDFEIVCNNELLKWPVSSGQNRRKPQETLPHRDNARLMVLNRETNSLHHQSFADLTEYLGEGDVLIINKARVNRAKLVGRKKTGGRVEVILVSSVGHPLMWKALTRPQMKPGTVFYLNTTCEVEVKGKTEIGESLLEFKNGSPDHLMKTSGVIALLGSRP